MGERRPSWSQKWHSNITPDLTAEAFGPSPSLYPMVLSCLSALDLSVPGRWAENGGWGGVGRDWERRWFSFS